MKEIEDGVKSALSQHFKLSIYCRPIHGEPSFQKGQGGSFYKKLDASAKHEASGCMAVVLDRSLPAGAPLQ